MLNSGLLTISKYPIVHTQFFEFSARAGVDAIALKGVLYSKIKMPNHHHLHVFNTHTQATYKNDYQPENKSDHMNFLARLKQIQEIRETIDKCLNSHSRLFKDGPANFKDIVLIAGDFNVNAKGKTLPKANFVDLPWVKRQQGEVFREYEYLIGVLSKDGKDRLVDLALTKYGKHPVTFADVDHSHEDGVPRPRELKLTNPTEHFSQQCLDYIFQLFPCADVESSPLFSLDPKDCKVNEFFVKQTHFTQLSDHYGIECSFRVLPLDGDNITSEVVNSPTSQKEESLPSSPSRMSPMTPNRGKEWEVLTNSNIKIPESQDPTEASQHQL